MTETKWHSLAGPLLLVAIAAVGCGGAESPAPVQPPTTNTPAPILASVSPSSGPAAGGTTAVLAGSGFLDGASVTIGGSIAPIATLSAASISITVPAHVAGVADVRVTNPDGQSATLTGGFTYLLASGAPPPVLSAMNVRGGPFAGGTTVLLVGTGLGAGTTVTFGGAPATGVHYDPVQDRLLAITPPDPLGPDVDGFVDVAVRNPDGQSATLAGTQFHYGLPPVPTGLATIAPVTLSTVHRGDTIVITGTDFTAASPPDPRAGLQVEIGGIATIVSRSSTQIVVEAPKNNPGTYQVVVVNFDGQYGVAPGTVIYPGP